MKRSALNHSTIASLDHRFRCLLRVSLIALLLGLTAFPGSAQKIRLKGAEFDPLAGPLPLQGLPSEKLARTKPAPATAKGGELRTAIVQWSDGLSNEKMKDLRALGGQPLFPLPGNAYLVMLPSALDLNTLGQNKTFGKGRAPRWAGGLAPEWKLDPRVTARLNHLMKTAPTTTTLSAYSVQFAYTGDEKGTRGAVKSLGGSAWLHATWKNFETWVIKAPPAAIENLARINGVFWIEPYTENRLLSERSGISVANVTNSDGSQIGAPGAYATWLKKVGLSGDGVTVSILDDGLSQGLDSNLPGTAHPDIIGRIVGIDNPTLDPLGNAVGGHGHLNASIIMGQSLAGGGIKDPGGYLLGQGIAPKAKIFATKIFENAGSYYTSTNYNARSLDSLIETAYNAGSRISSNSWGNMYDFGLYNIEAQLFDRLTRDASMKSGYQPLIFAFAAGNEGQGGPSTIAPPATGKNIISVGAGESTDRGETDQAFMTSEDADDLRDIAVFSSRGPLFDGRIGPTLFAPGTHVAGAASDDPAFDGSGVSGRMTVMPDEDPSANRYYPAHQNYYTWSSGTSHSCPAVAGALALVYEYCLKNFNQPPSPAMAKAMLVATAIDTAGGNRNFGYTNNQDKLANVPNNDAGWGRCSLAGLVDQTRSQFRVDQTVLLTFNNQSYQYKVPVADATKPLKIVLTWTDPPASTAAIASLVNDLDMTVFNGINTWRGNVFARGLSVPGGAADHVNNIECVFIDKPTPGIYTITISAFNLTGDALPDTGTDIEQDFALFVSNGNPLASQAQITLDKEYYRAGDKVTVSLSDLDLKGKGSASVNLSSLNIGDGEAFNLTEKPANSGFFSGTITLATTGKPTANNGILTACHNETIRATYSDNGGVQRTVQSRVDIKAPKLVSQAITGITNDEARAVITSDEISSATLYYGLAPTAINYNVSSSVPSTQHDLRMTPLMENAPYFYRIKLVDRAGNAATYDNGGLNYVFQTKQRKYDYYQDFENGTANWTHEANDDTSVDDWTLGQPYPDLPTNHAWISRDGAKTKDVSLISPAMTLKPNSTLQFWQWYKFQPIGAKYAFDGGVLEISTDFGTSWKDMGKLVKPVYFQSILLFNALGDYSASWLSTYDAMLSSGSGNPLGGHMAWSGRSWDKIVEQSGLGFYYPKDFTSQTSASTSNYAYLYPAVFDLAPYGGQTVQFRFRNSSDNNTPGDRWIVDDIGVWSPSDGVTSLTQIAFDAPTFTGSQSRIRFTLSDTAFSSGTGAFPTNFRLATPEFPDGLMITPSDLKMIDISGRWEGYLTVDAGPVAKSVVISSVANVLEGQSITLSYNDADVGDGSPYTVSTTTKLDWTLPVLLSNEVSMIHNHDFLISLSTNEPVTVTLKVGSSLNKLTRVYKGNVTGKQFEIKASDLAADTPYYYIITLRDVAGNVTTIDNGGFGFGVRTKSFVWMRDTLDGSTEFDWDHGADVGTDAWSVVENMAYNSPIRSWFGRSTTTRNDSSLVLPPVTIKEGYRLRFWHMVQLQTAQDGAVIEISKDQGDTWEDLGSHIITGIPYNYMIAWDFGSPIGGRLAWSGTPTQAMSQVIVDLSPWAGSGRLIRFRLACDNNMRSQTGWFIDDVTIDMYGPATEEFPSIPMLKAPAVNAGGLPYTQDLTLSWNPAPIVDKYRVYIGTDPAKMVQLLETVSTTAQISEPSLKPGTVYYWRVVSVNGTGVVPSALRSFKTQIVDPTRFVNQLLGKTPALTTLERNGKADFNADGKIDISDLVNNLKRR